MGYYGEFYIKLFTIIGTWLTAIIRYQTKKNETLKKRLAADERAQKEVWQVKENKQESLLQSFGKHSSDTVCSRSIYPLYGVKSEELKEKKDYTPRLNDAWCSNDSTLHVFQDCEIGVRDIQQPREMQFLPRIRIINETLL